MKNTLTNRLKLALQHIKMMYLVCLVAVFILSIIIPVYIKNEIIKGISINISSISVSVLAYYIFYAFFGIKDPLFEEYEEKKCEYKENFYDVDWGSVIINSKKMDIIVCYFDTWIQKNREEIKTFLKQGGELNIFIGNPEIDYVLKTILDRFPENKKVMNGEKNLLNKIYGTCKKIKQYAKEVSSEMGDDRIYKNVNIYMMSQSPNYSAIISNMCTVYFSSYEQFRDKRKKIQSPIFIIDIQRSINMRNFWEKELEGYIKKSTKLDEETCRKKLENT